VIPLGYTWAALLACAVAVTVDLVVLRTRMLCTRLFWASYAIIVVFQLLVNGVLTGTHTVSYDPRVIIGWRIAYAPVEDLGFGFALVCLTISLWEWWGGRRPAAR